MTPDSEHDLPSHGPPRLVGLIVHGGREEARLAASEAAQRFREGGVSVVGRAGDGWPDSEVALRDDEGFADGLDLVCVFGGDGTFLRAAYLSRDAGAPLLGVNLGRLGFLAEVEEDGVAAAVEQLIGGRYDVEDRMTLSVEVRDADGRLLGRSWALNEASVERTVPQRLIVLDVFVGETFFARIPADAVILATPTGSTAYAFSSGGPILSPLVDAILLTPVAPHSLFNRTIVVDPAESLSVRPVGTQNSCVVSFDGRGSLPVPEGGSVIVSRGEAPVRLARLQPFDFYARVREKFNLT